LGESSYGMCKQAYRDSGTSEVSYLVCSGFVLRGSDGEKPYQGVSPLARFFSAAFLPSRIRALKKAPLERLDIKNSGNRQSGSRR
jgi:hypothetical protein